MRITFQSNVGMAGWKTEDMLSGISGIMDLAAASGEDLGTTSDIVTDALTAFGLTAADSGHFADVLAAASSNANTNVSMMGETFKYVAPVAGTLNYSIAKSHYHEIAESLKAPGFGNSEVEHIRNTVLESAENENHNGQEHNAYLTDGIFDSFVSVSSNEHQHSAEKCEEENAQQIVRKFYLAHCPCLVSNARDTRIEQHIS